MAHSLLTKCQSIKILTNSKVPAITYQPVRTTIKKHWNPKFRELRRLKVLKVDLPDFNEDFNSLSKQKVRQKMKERGVLPPRPWMERPFYISSTGGVFEQYVPPEGDGKMSSITPGGAKQKLQFLEKKSKSMMAIRKIKSFEDEFDTNKFCEQAQEIYIKAHEALVTKDRHALRQFVTERAYPEFRHNTLDKTIHWRFLQSLEPPRLVHARCTDVITKENIFGQVTIRFHSQQQLAIYDRFGRLMHGSEIIAKDVLEYVVFEKHLSNLYGSWRVHDKLIPDWMPPKDPSFKTYTVPEKPLDVGITTEKEEATPSDTVPAKTVEAAAPATA